MNEGLSPAEVKARRDRARQIWEAQDHADLSHHILRVRWLSQTNPLWGCGTPVGNHDRTEMLRASRLCIRGELPRTNSCDCEPRCHVTGEYCE